MCFSDKKDLMRLNFSLVLAGFLAVSLLHGQAPRRRRDPAMVRTNPLGHSEQLVAQGREIYNRTCTVCHGLEGTLGDRGPALAGVRRYLRITDDDLFDAIRKGIAGTEMPPSGLAPNDAWKVVAYIRSLRATAFEAFVKGDVARGQQVFWGKGRCGECHLIQGRGGLAGPDLSSIGAERTLSFLREALTKPRPHIPRGYQPVEIVTAEGKTISGILKNEHNFSLQVLDTTNNKLELLTREEVRQVSYKQESLMPGDFDKKLAPAEFQDLLAFLSRQTAYRVRPEETEDDQ